LPRETWEEIQRLRWDGYTITELGKMFNIDPSQVSRKTQSKEERMIAQQSKKEKE